MSRPGPLLVFLVLGGVVAYTAHELATVGPGVPASTSAGAGPAADVSGEAGARDDRNGPGARRGAASSRTGSSGPGASGAHGEPRAGGEGPRVEVSRRRHPVDGTTARELRGSLGREGRRIEGETAPAWTDWRVDVGYDYRREGGRCRVTSPDVEVRVTVHLPRWVDSADASPELRRRWRRDLRAMERHEEGHVRLARRAGRRVHGALAGLPAGRCGRLRARADSAAAAVLEEARAEQRRYDDVTDHGRKQERAGRGV